MRREDGLLGGKMGRKEEILEYCEQIGNPATVVQIIAAICPGKPQPYLNHYVIDLVNEKKLIRNDNVSPYTVRVPGVGEEITEVKDYSRKGGWSKATSKRDDICTPCYQEAQKYILGWELLENYKIQENALNKLFFETFPDNKKLEEILIKVATLNEFYSTHINNVYSVAKSILELDIDDRLKAGDVTLVRDIAPYKKADGREINNYSFATKYCSHHNPKGFAIYDSYVDSVLKYFKNVDGFCEFGTNDLKNYECFISVLLQFRKFYGLDQLNLKLLDRYLWQLGKEKFPKKYN